MSVAIACFNGGVPWLIPRRVTECAVHGTDEIAARCFGNSRCTAPPSPPFLPQVFDHLVGLLASLILFTTGAALADETGEPGH